MPSYSLASMTKTLALIFFIILPSYSLTYPVYASSCDTESLNITRTCSHNDNLTQYLLSIKRGGTNIMSTSNYDKSFFLCEQYTFDCGYVEDENEGVSIANGIELKMANTDVDTILPSNATLATTLKHYLNLTASEAKCGMKVFPLALTASESDLFFTNYMNILVAEIQAKYAAQKVNNTKSWADLNVNIKTAVCEVVKEDKTLLYSTFWDNFKYNNFTQMSSFLKKQYTQTNKLYFLRSAYLIDSVTQRCNKYQSVSFLVDESGSIGATNFQLAKDFLYRYVNTTYDDPKLTSIHFYDTTFDPYLGFNHTKDQLLAGISTKNYRGGATTTGDAINKTVAKIVAENFDKGVNKILVVMTDGKSGDNVLQAANYARSEKITLIAVGITSAANQAELLQIAQTSSNMIKVSSYADLDKLVNFIENFFCKQIINVKVNETIIGNVVRVPESPAYFRLQRSMKNDTFELKIRYQSNPDDSNQVLYRSEYDPFPDQFTEYNISQSYRTSLLERVYFVTPVQQSQVRAKKNYQKVQSFTNSFVSVGGTNMKFNISLSPCTSTSCIAEKASYQAIGSKKHTTPVTDKDYNIYGIIAGSIAGLLCLSLLGALALKKMTGNDEEEEEDEEQKDKLQPEVTENDLKDDDVQSGRSQGEGKSSGSGSRSRSSKSSQRSDEEIESRRSDSKKKGLIKNDKRNNK